MTTVLNALRIAKEQFMHTVKRPDVSFSELMAMEQLTEAIEALESGKGPNDVLQDGLFRDLDKPYPVDWPRCPACGMPALDGHITCGAVACNEGEWRRKCGAEGKPCS